MISFEKSYLGKYPVIKYSVKATIDSREEYITECIIMNKEEATSSIRFIIESLSEDAFNASKSYFDSITLTTVPLAYEDTKTFGYGRITVK